MKDKDHKIYNKSHIITVKSNTQLLHPLTGNWINTMVDQQDVQLTKYKYENDNFFFLTTEIDNSKQNNSKSLSNYKKYLHIPPVGITSDIILHIYQVSDVDSFIDWINKNMNIYKMHSNTLLKSQFF